MNVKELTLSVPSGLLDGSGVVVYCLLRHHFYQISGPCLGVFEVLNIFCDRSFREILY